MTGRPGTEKKHNSVQLRCCFDLKANKKDYSRPAPVQWPRPVKAEFSRRESHSWHICMVRTLSLSWGFAEEWSSEVAGAKWAPRLAPEPISIQTQSRARR